MKIIEANPFYAVVEKPVGLDSEADLPAALREQLGGECYPVHRLDKNVGGLVLLARSREAAARLSRSVQQGEIQKEYVALVHGVPPEAAEWEDLLWKDSRKNKVFVVKRQRAGVKDARLEFRRLETCGEASLVRIRLHTGRSHQIRVQFASRGYPLVGDHKYGARDLETAPRLFSCALTFPFQGQLRHYEAYPRWMQP